MVGRILEAENGEISTKNNALDKYLQRDEGDQTSLYNFLCRNGRVPVITGTHILPSWPLTEDYSRTMLLLHYPSWRKLADIKSESTTWGTAMQKFLTTADCPNFVKAAVERAKEKDSANDENYHFESDVAADQEDQPEWMDLIRPIQEFEMPLKEFEFDDGGPDFNWNQPTYDYPDGALKWTSELSGIAKNNQEELQIPEVDITSMIRINPLFSI